MEGPEWRRIEEVFYEAVDLALDDRAAFLDRVCASDSELRRQVASLLASDNSKDGLLHAAIANSLDRLPAESGITGQQIGPYVVTGLIGKGGMGEVWRARDTRLNRDVALKMLPPDVASDEMRRRLEQEARLVATLNHPHICQLHDVGPDCLVFEYIDGVQLKGPVPAAEALRIALEIADALEEAHKHGIIHRDLKPSNIMCTARGVKVLDFGIAKQRSPPLGRDGDSALTDLTHDGELVGTPAYMAPEQQRGEPADVRTDIYSFGCVFYELVTGSRPGPGRRLLPSARLKAIVRLCLADDPAARFQSATELKAALAKAARSGGSRAKHAITAGALIVIAVAGAFFWHQRVHAAPKLTDRDILVVADVDNKTGDPVFDAAVKQALAFQLQQSPFLKAMDEEEIRSTLKRSGRSPDARVTGEVARDVCIREGQKAALEASVAALGSHYLIELRAVNCQTGETFAREQAEASSKESVIAALGRATDTMRRALGESLGTVQSSSPAYNQLVTTSSLEALQAFNMGAEEWGRTVDMRAAIPYFRRATEIDPNFAQAFALLAIGYHQFGDKAAAADAIGKAMALKDRVTEYERLFVEFVSAYVSDDLQKRKEIGELLVRKFPRDPVFHGNLAAVYIETGEPEKALVEAEADIRNDPRIQQGYFAAAQILIELNRLQEARAILKKEIANGLDGPHVHDRLLYISFPEGDRQAQAQEADWFENHHSGEVALFYQGNNAAALGHARPARELFRAAADLAAQRTSTASRFPLPPGILFPQDYLTAGPTTEALWGNCPHSGPRQPPVVTALCDPAAAKKFAAEQDAKGQTAIEGPGAVARSMALLADGHPDDAAKILSVMVERKAANWGPVYPAAQVLLARAEKQMGNIAGARKTYEQFLAFWRDADPDIPILRQARTEYSRLK
jgi:tetratricopeptide (TPR) repeat protein/predicted Ser/Thr protein kinase